jgi:hypothetical protein
MSPEALLARREIVVDDTIQRWCRPDRLPGSAGHP